MIMKYAMYLRKSRADIEAEALGEMETLARHKKILTELSRRNEHQIGEIYQEIVSGESIADRPQMQRLLHDVNLGKWKGVYVMEIERLARGDTRDQGEVAEAFKLSNTLIVTPVKTYDPTNQYDEEYFEFGLFMSRREYKTIQRRLQTGKMQSVKEGEYMGSLAPYGYDIIRNEKKERTLEPNDQAQYVVMMFDWFVNERLSAGEIARQLSNMGVLTLTGNREWNRVTVKEILKNETYTGKIRWNRHKTTKEFDGETMQRRKRRRKSQNCLIYDGLHPAIISQELFDRAQELMTGVVPVKKNKTIINPLSRLMFCKHCGKAIVYMSYSYKAGRVRPRYLHRESIECKVTSTYADDVIDAVIYALKEAVEDFEFKLTNEHVVEENRKKGLVLKELEKELTLAEKRRNALFTFLESGVYTPEEFMERKEVANKQIENIRATIEKMRLEEKDKTDYQEKIIKYTEVIDALKNENIDAKIKNDMLKDIISRIEYDAISKGKGKGAKPILEIFFK